MLFSKKYTSLRNDTNTRQQVADMVFKESQSNYNYTVQMQDAKVNSLSPRPYELKLPPNKKLHIEHVGYAKPVPRSMRD